MELIKPWFKNITGLLFDECFSIPVDKLHELYEKYDYAIDLFNAKIPIFWLGDMGQQLPITGSSVFRITSINKNPNADI